MHVLDLGLFKYMMDYTKILLSEQCGNKVVASMQHRFTMIPRFHGLKIMKNGTDLSRMTADEHRNVMKVIIFVLDNLYDTYKIPGISNNCLIEVYHKFLKMYLLTHQESFSNEDCQILQV